MSERGVARGSKSDESQFWSSQHNLLISVHLLSVGTCNPCGCASAWVGEGLYGTLGVYLIGFTVILTTLLVCSVVALLRPLTELRHHVMV